MASDKVVVLITGGNSGIGLETVLALAQESDHFEILLGSRSLEKGNAALETLRGTKGDPLRSNISVLEIDITSQKSIDAARDWVENAHGRLDVLINNAGIIVYRQCDTITNLRETFETNTFGPALVTETFEPLLKKSSAPQLIYVSSSQGSISLRLDPSYEHYHVRGDFYRMSKAALNMLAACHRYSFAEWGCKVCAFNPGFCVTNLTGEAGRSKRIEMGARDARDPATALVKIVTGQRDEDYHKSAMADLDGEFVPW